MAKKPICIICRERKATIRDRNEAPWGKRKRICQQCHENRLRNDMVDILEIEKKRRIGNHKSPFGMGA